MEAFFHTFQNKPAISLSIPMAGYPSILIDNKGGIRKILEHLINDHHYSRIGFIGGPVNNIEAEIRLRTYREVLEEKGIPFDPALVVPGDFTLPSGISSVRMLMNLLEKKNTTIDVLVAANDEMALGAVLELKHRGLRVPEDIAVTGFDDIDEVQYALPPFTTVKQPLYEMGRKGAVKVFDMLAGKKTEDHTFLETEVVLRQSCGCISFTPYTRVIGEEAEKKGQSLSDKKEKILARALKETRSILTSHVEGLEKELSLFFQSLLTGIETENEETVFAFLKERLFSKTAGEDTVAFWRQIILLFHSLVSENSTEPRQKIMAEKIFFNAQSIICDAFRFVYGKGAMFHIKELHILKDIILTLPLSMDISVLMDRVKKEVPKIGIDTLFISFFEEDGMPLKRSAVPTEYSNLMLAVVNGEEVDKKGRDFRFLSKKLLPGFLLDTVETDFLIFMPLNYKSNYYGFAAFSLDTGKSFFYESLRDQISVALDSTRLFQEMHLMSDEIMRQNLELKNLHKYKSEFFSKVSHELRTPMNTINGNIDLLRFGSYDASEEVLEELNRAVDLLAGGEWKEHEQQVLNRASRDLQNMSNHIQKEESLKTFSLDQLLKAIKQVEGVKTNRLEEILRGIYDLLKKEENETLTAYKKIKQASNAMIGLIDMILNLSKVDTRMQIESKEVTVTDFVAHEVEKGSEYAMAKNKDSRLVFTSNIDKNVPAKLKMDEQLTSRVLGSYICNAVEFSEEGEIKITVAREKNMVRFQVIDQGEGIREQDKSKIFTEFGKSSSRDSGGGTGLTLALSRRLIEMQGGKIGFESEYGTGSCFWFLLPL